MKTIITSIIVSALLVSGAMANEAIKANSLQEIIANLQNGAEFTVKYNSLAEQNSNRLPFEWMPKEMKQQLGVVGNGGNFS